MSEIKTAVADHPIQTLIGRRWSPYGYDPRPLQREDLRSLFEAARWAPSAFNEQPWRYIVAERGNTAAFERLLSCLVEGNQVWAKNASVLALGVTKTTFARNGKPNRHAAHDLGLATAGLIVEATARGLLVHQMGGILPEKARELYGIPEDFEPLTGIAIGYRTTADPPPPDTTPRTRHPQADFVFTDAWAAPL